LHPDLKDCRPVACDSRFHTNDPQQERNSALTVAYRRRQARGEALTAGFIASPRGAKTSSPP